VTFSGVHDLEDMADSGGDVKARSHTLGQEEEDS